MRQHDSTASTPTRKRAPKSATPNPVRQLCRTKGCDQPRHGKSSFCSGHLAQAKTAISTPAETTAVEAAAESQLTAEADPDSAEFVPPPVAPLAPAEVKASSKPVKGEAQAVKAATPKVVKDPSLCRKKGCSNPIFSSERVTRAVLCEEHYWDARNQNKALKAAKVNAAASKGG